MRFVVQTDRMLPIAYVLSHSQMRRSLVGALATDPVVPEPRRRTRLTTRAQAAHANEGAQTP
jgi:hypothetical protein